VFKGAGGMGAREIVERIEAEGGSLNASTGYERTSFEVRALHGSLPLAMQVVSDLVFRPTLDPAEIEREKDVVAQEIAEAFDTPDDHVFEMAQTRAFEGQPLGRPILGSVRSLKPITRAAIRDWRARLYSPDRMVVAVAGAGDRVKAKLVGLAVGVGAVGNDADALAFHVVKLGVTASQVEGDVVHPADGPISQEAVVIEHGADEGILRLVEIDGNFSVAHGGCGGLGVGWSRFCLGVLDGLRAGFRGGLRGRRRFRGRGSFGDGGLRTAADHPDAAAVAGDRLHQRLEAVEGHGEAALSLSLLADPVAFDHNREQAAIGSAGLVCGNAHAVVAP
jgi:hypothetical protein